MNLLRRRQPSRDGIRAGISSALRRPLSFVSTLPMSPLDDGFEKALKEQALRDEPASPLSPSGAGPNSASGGAPAIPKRSSSRNYVRPKSLHLLSASEMEEEDAFTVIDGIDQSIASWVTVGADAGALQQLPPMTPMTPIEPITGLSDDAVADPLTPVDSHFQDLVSDNGLSPSPPASPYSSNSGCATLSSVSSHFYRRGAVHIPFDEETEFSSDPHADEFGAEDFDPFVEDDIEIAFART